MKRILKASEVERLENTSFVTAVCGPVADAIGPAGDVKDQAVGRGLSICCNHTLCSGNTFAKGAVYADIVRPFLWGETGPVNAGPAVSQLLDPIGARVDALGAGLVPVVDGVLRDERIPLEDARTSTAEISKCYRGLQEPLIPGKPG